MSGATLSSVAYKKGNLLRYTLWSLAAICVAALLYSFLGIVNNEMSTAVPAGYRFSVSGNYNTDDENRVIYYIYDNRILVENENSKDRLILIYDNINTSSLNLDYNDTVEICESGSCHQIPKVVSAIKKLLSQKTAREYVGI